MTLLRSIYLLIASHWSAQIMVESGVVLLFIVGKDVPYNDLIIQLEERLGCDIKSHLQIKKFEIMFILGGHVN